MTKIGMVFRPVYVAQAKTRFVSLERVLKMPQVISQVSTVNHFANDIDRTLLELVVIKRTQAKFDPATDKVFQKLLDVTKSGQEIILIDNFLRLIDCRDYSLAVCQADYLKMNVPTLFSIEHGSILKTIPRKIIVSAVAARARQSKFRSESIKKGLQEKEEFVGATKPTRKAIDNAATRKSQIADFKAQALFQEIERVRQSMPLESRGNLTALADAMNVAGIETSSGGGQWQRITVKRVLDRMDRINEVASN